MYYSLRKLFLLVWVILFCMNIVPAAEDNIIIEWLPTHTSPPTKEQELDEKGKKKAEALSSFAIAYLGLKQGKKLDPELTEDLLNTLRNDPEAKFPFQLLLAILSKDKKKYNQECVDKLLPIAKENPTAIQLQICVVFSLISQEKYDQAIKILENSIAAIERHCPGKKKGAKFTTLLITLAGLYENQGNFAKGDDFFDEIFADSNFADNLKLNESAVYFYEKALAKTPESSWYNFFDNEHATYKKKLKKYLDHMNKLSRSKDIKASDIIPLISIYRRAKQYDKAKELILDLLLSNPDDHTAKMLLANVFYDMGKYMSSLRLWRSIIKSDKTQPGDYFEKGRTALMSRNYKEATEAFEWYLIYNSKNEFALYQLAVAYYELKNYKKFLEKVQKIKNFPEGKYLEAMYYRQENRLEDAVKAIEEAEKMAKNNKRDDFLNKDFYLAYAFMTEKMKDFKKTSEILENLLKKYPDNPEILNFLGYLWADYNQNLDSAEKMIRKALLKDSENSAYLDSLAWVFYRQGKYKEALEYIKKSLQNEEDVPDAVIVDHAGDIQAALGNISKAVKLWKEALEIYSEDLDQKKTKDKIKRYDREMPPPFIPDHKK